MNILLDMDGVLVDFEGGAARLFGTTLAELEERWQIGEWDICKVLELHPLEFWERIEREQEFWFKLEETAEARELYKMCKSFGDVYFCSSPCLDPQSAAGKMKWLNHFLNCHCRNFILTPAKHLVNGFLIDDCRANNPAFLWPRVGNGAKPEERTPEARLEAAERAIKRALSAEPCRVCWGKRKDPLRPDGNYLCAECAGTGQNVNCRP